MNDIAIKMLFGDRTKYALLISGICFATILMTQGLAIFSGILSYSYSSVKNIRAPIWITHSFSQGSSSNKPLRDSDLNIVRATEGVKWAVPLFMGRASIDLVNARNSLSVSLVGLDRDTFIGAPENIIGGTIFDLEQHDGVIVDESLLKKIARKGGPKLEIGDTFEMNERRAILVGITNVSAEMSENSYVYTTFDRAKQYVANSRKMLTHILAAPQENDSIEKVIENINENKNLKAMSEQEIIDRSRSYMIENSPLPMIIGIIVLIGFLIGTIVSGQTFYTFIVENTPQLGALKAMGASNWKIAKMIILQALIVGFIGFCIGTGIMGFFIPLIPSSRIPIILTWQVPVVVFCAILSICILSAWLSIRRMSKIETAIVFRS